MSTEPSSPRAFISYAWSSEAHKDWVRELAERLVSDGVDVKFDQWDLHPGHDAYAFMEQMVVDPTITKVIVVADRAYLAKSKSRKGGVGTEAQIISPEIYSKAAEQTKFVVVSRELGDDGEPCRPTFYKSRIYISMIDDGVFEHQYEELIRWVYGQPLRRKPALGTAPESIIGSSSEAVSVSALGEERIKVARRGLLANSSAADFLDAAFQEIRSFLPIESGSASTIDDAVWSRIEQMLPLSNQLVEVFRADLGAARSDEDLRPYLRFLERCLHLSNGHDGWRGHSEWSYDHIRYFVRELFVRVVSICLSLESFGFVRTITTTRFTTTRALNHDGPQTVGYSEFNLPIRSLDARNERLGLRRTSLEADLLKSRCASSGVDFDALIQADFVLYLDRAMALNGLMSRDRWWPDALIYISHFPRPFPLFIRSESKRFASRFAKAFGLENGNELQKKIAAIPLNETHVPRWNYEAVTDLPALTNLKQLNTFD